ncbi:hypothetical protein HPG69_008426 [Diceros bicornis minor]|uniref:NADP-dependent oxidoreductase domain-containing protein n=1 Tax=Diceros bicornis minor TaxID=77932 RepID=A0A7J7FL57_DICBM|nr:hypothetical protein HPG69_008426 [Diceros bicornis minor]
MDPKCWHMEFNDGHFIHVLGFGTYTHEEEVGPAIQSKIEDDTMKREDIFYTSKVLCIWALEKALKKLQRDYVNLYVIDFPMALKVGNLRGDICFTSCVRMSIGLHRCLNQPEEELVPKDEHGKVIFDTAIEKCKDAGPTKSIRVSNLNRRQLEKILNKPGLEYKPICNQVTLISTRAKCWISANQKMLPWFPMVLWNLTSKRMINQSSPVLLDNTAFCAMAKKYEQTSALIILCYQLQHKVVVLAKGYDENQMKENMKVMSEAVGTGLLNNILHLCSSSQGSQDIFGTR